MKKIAITFAASLFVFAACQSPEEVVEKELPGIPANCTAWFDGCNNCMVKDGQLAGCTRIFCPEETMQEPKCTAFEEEQNKEQKEEATSDDQLSVAKQCAKSGAKWLVSHNECEYTSKEWCDKQGGEFNECGSACRHQPEAELCTMQCVPFCKI